MAKWFRSEPMEYISLIMNEDAAHDCLGDLGKLGVIQFTDVRLLNINVARVVTDLVGCCLDLVRSAMYLQSRFANSTIFSLLIATTLMNSTVEP